MSRLQHHPPAERDSPPGRLHDAALQSYEDLTVFQNLDFVAHVYEMAASSDQEPRPASSISSMQAEDVSDYVVPLFLREHEHRHSRVRGGESYQ